MTPVNGDRITPPSTPASAISAQKPGPTSGNTWASSAPSAPPIMNIGASTPPEVPEPRDSDQISVFDHQDPDDEAEADRAGELGADHVVADARAPGARTGRRCR